MRDWFSLFDGEGSVLQREGGFATALRQGFFAIVVVFLYFLFWLLSNENTGTHRAIRRAESGQVRYRSRKHTFGHVLPPTCCERIR